jgi:ribosomal protein S18 acetylase RimI-like enzyme
MNITLRPLTESDLDFSKRVYLTTREEELAPLPWTREQKNAFLSMQFEAQRKSYLMQFPAAQYDVIMMDSIPAGRLITLRREKEILLIDIAILPEFRGKGIGTEILTRLQDEGRTSQRSIRLHVEPFNPACHLYNRFGFAVTQEDAVHQEMTWIPDPVK